MPSVIVVGAGWAGLNCAYELTKAGFDVTILEAAPQIGGRARSIKFQDQILDNGQHIGLGAYTTLRGLISDLGLDQHKLFKILPFNLQVLLPGKEQFSLKLPNLPAPFNLMAGLVMASNLSWSAKLQIIKFSRHLSKINFQLENDCSVLKLLQDYHQSSVVIERFWEPLALAAMSTAIAKASAQVFLNILQQVFNSDKRNSDWYLPAVDLSSLLPACIAEYLVRHNSTIICKQAIQSIAIEKQHCVHVKSATQIWQAEHVVLATQAWQTFNLLQTHAILQPLCMNLQAFDYEMITTLYFVFAQPIQLPYPIMGMLSSTCQWIFDRAFVAQPNILSVIITGPVAAQFSNNEALRMHVLNEIKLHFPGISTPLACKVIREKRAAFSCDVTIQKHRPTPATKIKNLWLCGDYLQTGLPATLEGALLSGKQTSEFLIAS